MKIKRNISTLSLILLLAACGGPSNSDIEKATNAKLEAAKGFQSLAGDNDLCPKTLDELTTAGYQTATACMAWHGSITNVEINKCIEKGDTKYSCNYSYTLVSERYGNHDAEQEAIFEETASGWKHLD